MIIKLASVPVALATNIVLARILGVDGLGVYGVAISIIMIAAMPVVTSLDTLIVRYVGKLHGDNTEGKVFHTIIFAIFNIVAATISFVGLILLYLLFFPGSAYSQVLPYALIFYPALLFLACGGALLRSLDYVTMGVLPEQILRQVIFLCVIGAMIFWVRQDAYSAADGLRLHAISNVITAAIVLLMLFYGMRSIKGGLLANFTGSGQWGDYYRSYWPLLILGFVQVASTHVPMLVMGGFGRTTDAGLYRVSEQLVGLVSLGLISVNLAFGPMLSRITTDNIEMQRAINKASKIIILMVIPAIFILMIWPDTILSLLFGEEFKLAANVLRIMCIGSAVSALVGPVGLVLNILGMEKYTLMGMKISLMVNLVMSIILVPIWGAIGAAISFSFSMMTWNSVLLVLLLKHTGLSTISYIIKPKIPLVRK
jgi:O-antigen/teichoic acid export membrane protein